MSVERAQEVVGAVGALRQVPDSPAEVRLPCRSIPSQPGAHRVLLCAWSVWVAPQITLPPMTRGTDAAAWYTSCATSLKSTLGTHCPLVVGVFMNQPVEDVNRLAAESVVQKRLSWTAFYSVFRHFMLFSGLSWGN